jgi:hypothetical protein
MDEPVAGFTIRQWFGMLMGLVTLTIGAVVISSSAVAMFRAVRGGAGFMTAIQHAFSKDALLLVPAVVESSFPPIAGNDEDDAAGGPAHLDVPASHEDGDSHCDPGHGWHPDGGCHLDAGGDWGH